jgi:hypothetical protein
MQDAVATLQCTQTQFRILITEKDVLVPLLLLKKRPREYCCMDDYSLGNVRWTKVSTKGEFEATIS